MIAIASFAGASVSLLGIIFAIERICASRQAKLRRLISKYNDYGVSRRILRREIWQGQTEQQLFDARGEPASKSRPLAAPERETWVYDPKQSGRDYLRVIEQGLVIGWVSARKHRLQKPETRPKFV